jgi:DNA-binding response OmpR family regulator
VTTNAPTFAHSSIGNALLISSDYDANEYLVAALTEFAITGEVCADVSLSFDLLNRRKFLVIIVDLLLGDKSLEVLERVRLSRSNQTTVVFAIAANDDGALSKAGAHFVIRRPLSVESIRRTLQAAYGSIVREHRRYFRCPLGITISIRDLKNRVIQCHTLNISEGGLAITTPEPFKPGERVHIFLFLSGHLSQFATESEICWCDKQGRVGLRFVNLSTEQRCVLQDWLAHRLEESLPESIARKFQR